MQNRGEVLGEGRFSITELWERKKDNKKVAIKFVEAEDAANEELSNIKTAGMENEGVVEAFEVVFDGSASAKLRFGLVMEFLEGETLAQKLKLHEDGADGEKLPEDRAKSLFRPLINALHKCHANNVVHRDVKPWKIIVTGDKPNGDYDVKLIGFTYSKKISGKGAAKPITATTFAVGTIHFWAPEFVRQVCDREYDARKLDVWSSGVVLYCMLVGHCPFYKAGENDVESLGRRITTEAIDFPKNVSRDCTQLFRCILSREQKERWDFQSVLQHEWFAVGPIPVGNIAEEDIAEEDDISARVLDPNVDEMVPEAFIATLASSGNAEQQERWDFQSGSQHEWFAVGPIPVGNIAEEGIAEEDVISALRVLDPNVDEMDAGAFIATPASTGNAVHALNAASARRSSNVSVPNRILPACVDQTYSEQLKRAWGTSSRRQ